MIFCPSDSINPKANALLDTGLTVIKVSHRNRACWHDMHNVYTMYTGPRQG